MLDRSQAAGRTGRVTDELHSAKREARGGTQAHRGAGHCGFPEDCGRGDQPAAARMEGHRSDGEVGGELECQNCDHWESEERTSAGAGTEITDVARTPPTAGARPRPLPRRTL